MDETGPDPEKQASGANDLVARLRAAAEQTLLHVVALCVLILVCFGASLGNAFLADDYNQVFHCWKTVTGAWEMLWQGFTENYMRLPSTNVYRPWFLVSMVADCYVWRSLPFGYYLSNLLYFAGCVVLFYLTVRTATVDWNPARSGAAAFFAAALFAANPLRCESISWVVGRVDTVCCFFYLAAVYALLRMRLSPARGLLWGGVSLLSFWLALLTKEMAIGLPVLAAAIGFLWPRPGATAPDGPAGLRLRLRSGLLLCAPYLLSAFVYLGIRYLAIGTVLGGYTGVIGAAIEQSMIERWLWWPTWYHLFFPLSYAAFPGGGMPLALMSISYLLLLGIVVWRLSARAMPWKWLLLIWLWSVTTLLPVYKLWGLGYNLEGARLYFFFSLPMSLLWAVLAFYPYPPDATSGRRAQTVAAGALTLMAASSAWAAVATNQLWLQAGDELRALTRACENVAAATPLASKVVLLGLPKDRGGAHTLYNGEMFAYMTSPPFTRDVVANKFYTFDPFLVGPAQFIDATRLRRLLVEQGVLGPLVWSGRDKGLVPVMLEPFPKEAEPVHIGIAGGATPGAVLRAPAGVEATVDEDMLTLSGREREMTLEVSGLAVDPMAYDFLEFDLSLSGAEPGAEVVVTWTGDRSEATDPGTRRFWPPERSKALFAFAPQDLRQAGLVVGDSAGEFRRIRLRLSRYWRWFASGTIRELSLRLPACERARLKDVRLIGGAALVPVLDMKSRIPSGTGVYYVTARDNTIAVDCRKVSGAVAAELEITRPNFFFESFLRGDASRVVASTLRTDTAFDTATLGPELFPEQAFYQVRASCLGKDGRRLGEPSDPVTLYVVSK